MHVQECEICKNTFVAGYGYSLMLHWAVTGHAYVGTFVCPTHPSGQHWGCSPEHAILAAQKCLNEHMGKEQLLAKHAEQAAQGRTRYSPEDEKWAKNRGADFHLIEITGGFF